MEALNRQAGQIRESILRLFHRHAHLNLALIDQAIVSGVNFLTGILLARFLGIEEFGHFTLLWMIVLFINSLQTAFIIAPMMSIGCKQESSDEASYYGALTCHQIIFTMLSTVVLFPLCYLINIFYPQWGLGEQVLPLVAVSSTYQLQEFVRRYFFTRNKPVDALANDVISYIGQLLLLLLLYNFMQMNTALVLWVIAATSTLSILAAYHRFGILIFNTEKCHEVWQRHYEFSKWLVASTLLTWLSGNLLLIAAGTMLGAVALGVLKACQNIVAIMHILFNALSNLIPSQAGKILSKKGISALDNYLIKTTVKGSLITFLLMLPAFLFPTLTLKWLYGPSLEAYGNILFLYSLVYLVMFANQILTFALRALEKTSPIFFGYLATSIISVAIAYPLIHYFALIGVTSGLLGLAIINGFILFKGFLHQRKSYLTTTTIG